MSRIERTVRLPKAHDWLPIRSSLVENFSLNLAARSSTSSAWDWLAIALSVNFGRDSLKHFSQYSLAGWSRVRSTVSAMYVSGLANNGQYTSWESNLKTVNIEEEWWLQSIPVHLQVVNFEAAILVPGHAWELRLEDRASKEVLLPAVLLRV